MPLVVDQRNDNGHKKLKIGKSIKEMLHNLKWKKETNLVSKIKVANCKVLKTI